MNDDEDEDEMSEKQAVYKYSSFNTDTGTVWSLSCALIQTD